MRLCLSWDCPHKHMQLLKWVKSSDVTTTWSMLFLYTVIHQLCVCNSSLLPSLSRMLTVTISLPGRNEAGAVTLPETTKFSVPSRSWSSQILIRTWTLLSLAPLSNVTFLLNVSVEFSREKSSPSVKSEIKVIQQLTNQCSSTSNLPVALPLTTATVTIIGSWRVTLGGMSWNWISRSIILSSLAVVVFSRNSTWIAVCVHVSSF